MNDKNLIKKIQNDLVKSNPKIISNLDNESTIKKTFSSKYTEDISDSEDDDLTSYKNRNLNIVNQLTNKKTKNPIEKNTVKVKSTKSSKTVDEELKQIENELESNKSSIKKNKDKKNNKNSDTSDLPDQDESDLDSEHQYEYTEELKKKVVQYVKNDDRIRELQTELRTLNSAKKVAENDILKHLERLGETNINITGGKLRINQYESKEGLKEDIIKEALSEKIKDPKIIEFIFEKINEKRTAGGKVQVSLKRTFERGDVKKGKK